MDFGDLHPNQVPTEWSVRQDLGRMDENFQSLIAQWRSIAQAGGDPRANMPAVARALLGRLFRAFQFFQDNPGEVTTLSNRLGITPSEITDAFIARRDALRTFRDADISTKAKAVTAVNALEAAFPAPKTPSVVVPFLQNQLPADW
jgi:hypothetical protein